MMKAFGAGILLVCSLAAAGCASEKYAFDDLVPTNVVVERVATGFQFVEGPVWVPGESGSLLFSDIPGNTIYRWREDGDTEVYLHPVLPEDSDAGGVGGSNGLALESSGKLILCEHGNRAISRIEDDGSRTILADHYRDKRLNSPNDIVFHSSGAAYFTDPPYGLVGQDSSPAKEQMHNGIYRLDPDGSVSLVAAGQTRPNGIGLSPDERTLYVSNSDEPPGRLWMSYPVLENLSLGEGSVFFDASKMNEPGNADGLTLDQSGNIYATGPGGVLIINSDGELLGTIPTDEGATNVAWGDDGSTLYITAHTSIYRIKINSPPR
jgi:gluconolactonase